MSISLIKLLVVFTIIALPFIIALLAPSKGKRGENKVAKTLMKLSEDYTIFNDITIRSDFGTTQIDHIVVSKFGIFVIETKNYSGYISGHENSDFWTQNIWGHKYKLYNPVKQNLAHIISLKKVVKTLPYIPIIPIVVFMDRANLRVTTKNANILYRSQLLQFIESYKFGYADTKIVSQYVEAISLAPSDITVDEVKLHKKDVKKQIKEYKDKIQNGICPRCGGDLIYRKGKYGKFYGCSNYPKCKYTLSIQK